MKQQLPDQSAVRLVDDIIARAIAERASDIHLEPRGGETVVRFRIDGILRRIMTLPPEMWDRVAIRLKVLAHTDVTRKRLPLDGRMTVGKTVDIRMSTLPTVQGEVIVLRILDRSLCPRGAKALGMEGETLRRYHALTNKKEGLILFAGPTGSGKSSTMYEMITDLICDEVNIVTLEDPVEYDITGANQVEINEQTGLTFSLGMRSALRQDPDIIVIGEIRDAKTAQVAFRAAVTGHLVLATVHAQSGAALPDRLADLGVTEAMLSQSLRGVIIQRLVRRVCGECHGSGCDACRGTGYLGRIGLFGIQDETVTAQRLREADDALTEQCRDLITRGITTKQEARRVLGTI